MQSGFGLNGMDIVEGDESCWPARGRPALRKARALAVKKKLSQYTATIPFGQANGTKEATFYINYAKCPNIIERVVEEYTGPKQGQRPHKQARDAGEKRVRDALTLPTTTRASKVTSRRRCKCQMNAGRKMQAGYPAPAPAGPRAAPFADFHWGKARGKGPFANECLVSARHHGHTPHRGHLRQFRF